MSNAFFEQLMQSVQQMDGILRGDSPPSRVFVVEADSVNAKAVRKKTGLSQSEFAKLLRVSPKTLRNWEQHRRTPSGPAAALLTLVNNAPEVALSALHA